MNVVERLKQYTTCDVSDALLKLNVPHGGVLADLVVYSPVGQASTEAADIKIVGEAYTVQMVPNDDKSGKIDTHYVRNC